MFRKKYISIFLLLTLAFALVGLNVSAKKKTEESQEIFKDLGKDEVEVATETSLLEKDIELDPSKLDVKDELVVEVTADNVRYDQEANFYEAIGDAEAFLPDRNVDLKADNILYDGKTELMEAIGNVKIIDNGDVITGSYASFRMNNDDYLLHNPRLYMKGLRLKARVSTAHYVSGTQDKAPGEREEIVTFEDGVLALDTPQTIFVSEGGTNTKYRREVIRETRNRQPLWNDLPDEPRLKYSAREIFYDSTKKVQNLKIKGARVWLTDKISIPSPVHYTTTVGEAAGSDFVGPVFGNGNRVGGFAMGPRFYHTRDNDMFTFAPIVQLGGDNSFGGGAFLTYNRYDGNTRALAGYGTLENRFILNARQRLPWGFALRAMKNQNVPNPGSVGSSQVGEFAGIEHQASIRVPFVDERQRLRLYNSIGFVRDNSDLFSGRRLRQLERRRGEDRGDDFGSMFSQHFVSFYSRPFFRLGNELYNVSLRTRNRGTLRFYGTGDYLSVLRYGPAIEARIKNLAFEIDYLISNSSGQSPFLFDQFIEGRQAVQFDGDYKINDWISVGAFTSYNLTRQDFSRSALRTVFGPKDFKIRVGYDVIDRQIRFGMNAILGYPLDFEKLEVKTN